jgi:hypothetical protein
MSKEMNHTSDLTLYVSSFLSQLPLPLPQLLLGSRFGLEDTQHLLHNTRFNSSLNSKDLSLSLSLAAASAGPLTTAADLKAWRTERNKLGFQRALKHSDKKPSARKP